ncbi:MAG: hypothetical protein Q4F69_10960 [Bacteroidia bacterium]|nr:hypothetical protein [Bacteroidia bacterium]
MKNVEKSNSKDANKSIKDLKIKVTSPCFDDIGKVLNQLGIKYNSYDGDLNCDILFLNCGTPDGINHPQLKSFVENGGILYASDLTSSHIISTWPELMTVTNNTSACKIRANIVDKDLRQYIGNTIEVEFDMGVWSKIVKTTQGKVLMQSADEGFPIMMEFAIGRGKVFYTSFHNHAQTSEMEKDLLQLLVIKQISVATDLDFQKTIDIISVSMKPTGSGVAEVSKPQTDISSSIIAKWRKKDGCKTFTTEEMADNIKSKWRK